MRIKSSSRRTRCLLAVVVAALTVSPVVALQASATSERSAVHDRASTNETLAKAAKPASRGTSERDQVTEQFTEQVTSQQFTAITPYRTWDTRINSDRKWFAGDDFNIDVTTDTQGNQRIPANAVAVAFNVTVTETESGFGYVSVFNGDATLLPDTSTVNWSLSNFTIANGGIVGLGQGQFEGEIGIYLDGAFDAAAEVLIDITGYYG